MRRYIYCSVAFLLLGTLSLRASNIVANSSFELPAISSGTYALYGSIPGWTLASGPFIEIQNHVAGSPYAGAQFVELDSTAESSISQDLTTIAGAHYLLSFAFSPRPGVTDNIMGVTWGGSPVTTITVSGAGLTNTDWNIYSFDVAASGGTTQLKFSGLGTSNGVGEYLDAVSVEAVPEPSSIILCLGGLLFATAKYRKHAARRV